MPVVQGTDVGTGFRAWYETLPPVTRTYATVLLLMTAGIAVKLINPYNLALMWPLVFQKWQLWRLFTSALFLGPFSFGFALQLIWLLTYGAKLESATYGHAPADYVFMLLFGGAMLALLSPMPFVNMYFTAPPLVMMVLYVWSKNFPDQSVSIWGLVTLKSFYLPFAMLALTVLMGGDPIPDVVGILVGHVWWFLTDLYPATQGVQLLRTPAWLKRVLADVGGLGGPEPPRRDSPAVAAPGFSAFRGRGQRLGAS